MLGQTLSNQSFVRNMVWLNLCKYPTWRTILFLIFVYSNSLHVSSIQVLIIRRVNCINAKSGKCMWPCGMQINQHTTLSSTYSDIYQMSYWYSWLSWWWALDCLKHVDVHLNLHTTRSSTYSDIYQRSYWYSWLSWWWALSCSKHVENWNKQIYEKELSVKLVIYNRM